MNYFKRAYLFWISSINPKWNRNVLKTPEANLSKLFEQKEIIPSVFVSPKNK